ncbi:VOC family protein [Peribacillus sp. V2I11]|nr:VOC family protein [Peribacillus sp. V2I11]MDQ0882995.1 catechol 2,3-dioxygenase-like lactoylglutathione lyase family enzyme [Peribacillus sp. V2I11]
MTAITHVGLAVPDLDAAIKWYEQVLGFRLLVRLMQVWRMNII